MSAVGRGEKCTVCQSIRWHVTPANTAVCLALHLQTLPETGISGTHLFCFLNHSLEVRQRTWEELLQEGFPYTCCCQHGSKLLKFGCSLMCTGGNFCFGLSVRKLDLWTSTLACADSELCWWVQGGYVWHMASGADVYETAKGDLSEWAAAETLAFPCGLPGRSPPTFIFYSLGRLGELEIFWSLSVWVQGMYNHWFLKTRVRISPMAFPRTPHFLKQPKWRGKPVLPSFPHPTPPS